MTNILTADDATFIGGVGNWVSFDGTHTELTTADTPTPPFGGRVLKLTNRSPEWMMTEQVRAIIWGGVYPTSPGTHYSLDMQVAAASTNLSTGVEFLVQVVSYDTGSGSAVEGAASITGVEPGSGWQAVHLDDVEIAWASAVWVGLFIRFAGSVGGDGIRVNESALVANVVLAPPSPLGGWGVGMVRMGTN